MMGFFYLSLKEFLGSSLILFCVQFIHTLESRPDFNARSRGYFASLLTVALHGKLEYYTDIMRTLLLELMDEHVQNKNPKLMLRR